ncbi:MAG: metal ABC transporter permease [Ignavibacteriales bacterium]|nr:metal ABC transporter permease [Ignavibacteriales bacterium]
MHATEIITTIFDLFPFALGGSIIAAILCSHIGVYVVSKRIVFFGAALTQIAVAGIAFAHLPFVGLNPAIGSALFTTLAAILLSQILRNPRIPRDAVLGVSFVVAIALRILMIQKSPAAEASEIETLSKGDILFVTSEQFLLLAGAFIVVMAIFIFFRKEFLFVSYDPETAQTQGFNSRWWELFFFVTAGIAISVATRIVGDVFVLGFLTIPPVAAIAAAKRVRHIFGIALLLSLLPPIIGMYGAFALDLPAGPTMVAAAFLLLVLGWGGRRLRSAFASEN